MDEGRDPVPLDCIDNLVSWYQQKIGAYDKQLWEKSVEQKVLKGLNQVPRKSARVKAELIDVDLVRGSTFTKAKPQYSWLAVSANGLLRVFFMPVYLSWWSRVTSGWFAAGLLVLYCLQIAASVAFTLESEEHANKDKLSDLLSSVHIIVPWFMMILLGVLHSHIVATRPSQKSSSSAKKSPKREATKTYRKKRGIKGSQRDSGSQETGVDTGAETGYDVRVDSKPDVGAPPATHIRTRKLTATRPSLDLTRDSSKNRKGDRLSLNLPGISATEVNKGEGVMPENEHSGEPSVLGPSVKIWEPQEQVNGFPVVANGNSNGISNGVGLDGSSGSEVDLLCGNSQEDAASLNQPLLETVGSILIPDEDGNIHMGPDLTATCAEPGFTDAAKVRLTVKPSENECPSEANSSLSESGQVSGQPKRSSKSRVRIIDKNVVSSCESDVDTAPNTPVLNKKPVFLKARLSRSFPPQMHGRYSVDTDCGQTSEMEWEETGLNSEVTTSDTTNCSSPDSDSDGKSVHCHGDLAFNHHVHNVSSVLGNLASNSDKVSCMIWEGEDVKKVDLTVLELGWIIIQNVEQVPRTGDYLYFGIFIALLDTLMPLLFRIYHTWEDLAHNLHGQDVLSLRTMYLTAATLFGTQGRILLVVVNSMVQRLFLSLILFFLLSVAERTFKQRLLYAKNFCYLTSTRRARKYQLPHFRLNKVRNIKTWLSLRSYLKKRGPQRSVDIIVSAAFLTAVMLVSLMSVQLLNDSTGFLDHIGNWELILWCFVLATYLLRFMTLGTKINKKYRNFSVLITEQINLYLHMEQKPHKKEELMRANSVLKLAEDLLKELESPFKISGLSANPFLYNLTKVVVLSAFSAVLTELLGFKLKLYKIKLRA